MRLHGWMAFLVSLAILLLAIFIVFNILLFLLPFIIVLVIVLYIWKLLAKKKHGPKRPKYRIKK